jgi:ubiquinol-cytochrome c reductase iron-sulfur subunit
MAMSEIARPYRAPSEAAEATPLRRDFLKLVLRAGGVIGLASLAWPLIDSMEPARDTLAAGAPVDVDLSRVASGQQIMVLWRGKPVFIVNRPPAALHRLREPALIARLSDPASEVHQQPGYARNWHRSIVPEYAVMVGICTHLGCLPGYLPNPNPTIPVHDWLGGYLCPCHGSKYDLAGRVISGVPAPFNLPIPPYRMLPERKLRIGENPPGQRFDFSSIVQL